MRAPIVPFTAVVFAAVVLASGVTAAAGEIRVHATLTYTTQEGIYREARLKITRGGVLRLSTRVRRLSDGRGRLLDLRVRDLDADDEPEVALDLYTNGAHCCTQSLIYRYDPTRRRYRPTFHDWGNAYPGYRLVDPDHDARPELRSHDDRFAYAFTSFAGSAFPVRIWHFDHGRMFDVTRQFPDLVAADARANWHTYLRYKQERSEIRGALAAWLADEYLIGREDEGWSRLETLARRGQLGHDAAPYLRALRSFLRKLGYVRS